jgi:hypothetical protein
MKKILLLLCLLIFSFACTKPTKGVFAEEITIIGTITDDGNTPLENCKVELLYNWSWSFNPNLTMDKTITNEFGKFIICFSQNKECRYYLNVGKSGYEGCEYEISRYKSKQHFDIVLTEKVQ